MNTDIVITIDADAQHNPEEIPNLIETLKEEKAINSFVIIVD